VSDRYLIEVPHPEAKVACARAVDAFLRTGSHFLTNADWGCRDGEHKAWIIVDVDSKEEARGIVPPVFRAQAKITKLNGFTLQEIEEILKEHQR
jgi:hypothetical protein